MLTSLRDQVRENMENALENVGDETLFVDPEEAAREMYEMTTFTDETVGEIVRAEDFNEDDDFDDFIRELAGYVKEWQEEKNR